MKNKKHILIIGLGSVGKRHMTNMADLNCELSGMDPDVQRIEEANKKYALHFKFTSLEQIGDNWKEFDGVVICSPPKFHKEQCIAVAQHGIHILLEKPLTKNLKEAINLKEDMSNLKGRLLLGYTYRWWKPLLEFKEFLQSGKIGKPIHAKFIMSAHLEDWHPWEDYRNFFMSSKDLGGGALLDESHFIDLMIWMFGMPKEIYARVEKLSDLDIETDDNVDIIAKFDNNFRILIHLDLYGRPHEKYISITGDNGTIEWSFDPNRVRYSNSMNQEWQEKIYNIERNEMFVEVAKEFIGVIDGTIHCGCTLNDGLKVMRVLDMCRKSSCENKYINLDSSFNIN